MHGEGQWTLGCPVCNYNNILELTWMLASSVGLNLPLLCKDSGLCCVFRTLSSASLLDPALYCKERLSELQFPIYKMGVIFPLFSLQGFWD